MPGCVRASRNCAFTAGKREAGSPTYTYGLSALGSIGALDLGVTAKRTGPRYIFDNNAPLFSGDVDNLLDANPANDPVEIFRPRRPRIGSSTSMLAST